MRCVVIFTFGPAGASAAQPSGLSVLFRLQLREEDHVADAFLAEEHHAQAVDADAPLIPRFFEDRS